MMETAILLQDSGIDATSGFCENVAKHYVSPLNASVICYIYAKCTKCTNDGKCVYLLKDNEGTMMQLASVVKM